METCPFPKDALRGCERCEDESVVLRSRGFEDACDEQLSALNLYPVAGLHA